MNNRLPNFFKLIGILALLLCAPLIHAHAASSLQFSPTTKTVTNTETFVATVSINVESATVMGSDTTIIYAGTDLEVTGVTNGGFFPEFNYANNPSGRLELHGYTSSLYDSKTGTGTLASITFKSKKGVGTNAVVFSCDNTGNDTNILNTGGVNILTCTQVNQLVVTYTGGGDTTVTNTPTATTAPGQTSTPTVTPIPGTNTTPVCASLSTSLSEVYGSPQTVSFTCSGVDIGGYINAIEFIYGDGTKQVIEKNIGSPGTLTTTHTYTTIGTLGASCRVRDNDNVYSSVSDGCKKIIKIHPKPSVTSNPANLSGTGTPRATPAKEMVSIISETPDPTPSPIDTPVEENTEESLPGDSNRTLYFGGGAIALILAFLLLRRKKAPPPIPPITMSTPQQDYPQQ